MLAIGSIVYRHQRWQICQPELQNTVRERNQKVRTPCFVPPGHVVPTAFSGMTHNCTQNSVKTATGVFDFGLKCHFSGLLFPKSANNRHSSMIQYIPSAILGRNPGQRTIFLPSIRTTGEKPRTRNDFYTSHPCYWGEITDRQLELYTLPIFQAKSYRSVFQNTTRQAQDKAFSNMDPYRLIEVLSKKGSHRHKSICASLQVSLAQIDLNRWRAYMPAVMPARY